MALEFALLDVSYGSDDAPRNFRREFSAALDRYVVRDGERPPAPTTLADWRYDGVVVTGSPASVYWDRAWLPPLKAWIGRADAADVPMLGVCFGHQLLASALGGRVESMGEYELGYHMIRHDGDCPLFAGLDEWFVAFTAHSDEVVELPDGAVAHAWNPYSLHAFRRGRAYGVQFHPEMALDTAREVMAERGADGEFVDHMLTDVTDHAHNEAAAARVLFENFERLARQARTTAGE